MVSAADCHVIYRPQNFFGGINDLDALNLSLFAFLAHNAGKGANRSLRNVGHLKLRRVQLVPRAHAANDFCSRFLGLQNQIDFCRHRVHRVNDVIIFCKVKLAARFWKVKAFVNVDLRVGVDVKDSLLHHVDFVFSDAGAGRDDLPVQVCQAHFVVVHKVNMKTATLALPKISIASFPKSNSVLEN